MKSTNSLLRGFASPNLYALCAGVGILFCWSIARGQAPQGFAWPHSVIDASNGTVPGNDLVVADFNGDGFGDAATFRTGSQLEVYLNQGPPNHSFARTSFFPGLDPAWLEPADINGDGRPDLLYVQGTTLGWIQNNGAGAFNLGSQSISSGQFTLGRPSVADFDGDGDLDIVALREARTPVWFDSSGGPAPIFTKRLLSASPAAGWSAGYFDIGDFNGDGRVDLLSFPYIAFNTGGLEKEAFGPWTLAYEMTAPTPGSTPVFARAGDLNGDGRADVVFWGGASSTRDRLFVFFSPATFENLTRPESAGAGYAQTSFGLELADIDGDGALNPVASRSSPDSTASWWRRQADGVWEQLLLGPHDMKFVDVNGDGRIDGIGHPAPGLSWLPNPGPIPFFNLEALELRDVDGDGAFSLGESGSLLATLRRGGPGVLGTVLATATAGPSIQFVGPNPARWENVPERAVLQVAIPFVVGSNAPCGSPLGFDFDAMWTAPIGTLRREGSVSTPLLGMPTAYSAPLLSASPNVAIPDGFAGGAVSPLTLVAPSDATTTAAVVTVDVAHSYRGDLRVVLTPPAGASITLFEGDVADSADDLVETFAVPGLNGRSAPGLYRLSVIDRFSGDTGTFRAWSLAIDYTALDCAPWQPPMETPAIDFEAAAPASLSFSPGDGVFTGHAFGWQGVDGAIAIGLPAEPPVTLIDQNGGSWRGSGLEGMSFYAYTLHGARATLSAGQPADDGASTRLRAETLHGSLDHVYNINDNQGGPHGPPTDATKTYSAYFRPSDIDLNGQNVFAFDSIDNGNPFGSLRAITMHGLEFGSQDANIHLGSLNPILNAGVGNFATWQYENYGPLTLPGGIPLIEGGAGEYVGGALRHADDADPATLAGGAAEWLYQPPNALESVEGALYRARWTFGFDDGPGDDGHLPRVRTSPRTRQAALSVETSIRGDGPLWAAATSAGQEPAIEQYWTGHSFSTALNGPTADDYLLAFGLFNFANGDAGRDGYVELRALRLEELAPDDPNTP
jgi:subtilisin-like proprotein convertase family protein